jgi:hypothetical protein
VVVRVIAGVVVAVATVPANPLALTTDTEVTVPDVAGFAHDGGDPVVAVRTCPVVPSANMEGMPVVPVIKTPLFPVARPATVLAELEYKIWFIDVVAGHVDVDHAGVVLAPDCSIWRAVAVPERIAPALAVE